LPPSIVTLDVGSSSVRTLLFDERGEQLPDLGAQLPYRVTTTPDGGVEVDADRLAGLCISALDTLHDQAAKANLKPSAVGFSAFWHCFLGVDSAAKPATAIIHLFDTRSEPMVEALKQRLDVAEVHARTGCMIHTSYWPAKLLFLERTAPAAVASVKAWLSFGEYLFLKLFGRARASTSMVSGSGLWNQNEQRYEELVLRELPVALSQLASPADLDQPESALLPEFARRWPAFDGIPWYPAIGDGACDNIGSGCVRKDQFALMVGTSGAMRVVLEQDRVQIPAGLWCYRVDPKRFVMGGALSNGGDVFAWMRRTLQLPDDAALQTALAAMKPGGHGLTLLPFFAGERSPYWRADLRALFLGLTLDTLPIDILRASLESVALRFRQIDRMLSAANGEPDVVIASGGALFHSPVWSGIMADALGRRLTTCIEPEASSRGAALLAMERIGALDHVDNRPPCLGAVHQPDPAHEPIYAAMLASQQDLYNKVWQ
jgi:gluconokinase